MNGALQSASLFLGRQPILDRRHATLGYEFHFRTVESEQGLAIPVAVALLALTLLLFCSLACLGFSCPLAVVAALLSAMFEDALHGFAVVGTVGGDSTVASAALAARLLPLSLLTTRILAALPLASALLLSALLRASLLPTFLLFSRLLSSLLLPARLFPACLLVPRRLLSRLLLLTALPLPLRAHALPLLGSLPLVLPLPLLIARLLSILRGRLLPIAVLVAL